MYEIVLGGWGNTKVCVRDRRQGPCLAQAAVPGIMEGLDTAVHVNLQREGDQLIITGSSMSAALTWKRYGSIQGAKYVGVMTGWGSAGEWDVCLPELPPPTHCGHVADTPNNKEYHLVGTLPNPDDDWTIDLHVKATNDAHVGLSKDSSFLTGANQMYEIVLGGWGNTKVCVRDRRQGPCLAQAAVPGIMEGLDTAVHVNLQREGDQLIITGSSMSAALTWKGYGSIQGAKYVGVMTGWGSAGEWDVCFPQLPPPTRCGHVADTPNNKEYHLVGTLPNPDDDWTIDLHVKATNDAHVGLSKDSSFLTGANQMYEIVLGGWGNTKVCVRDR